MTSSDIVAVEVSEDSWDGAAALAVGLGKRSPVSGVSLADPTAAAGATFTATLTDSHGLLSATGAGVTGSGSATLTITGTLSQVNADLATLADTDTTLAADTITITATDSLGGTAAAATVPITVNAAPALTLPAAVTITQNQPAAVTVGLTEAGMTAGEAFTVTVADTAGLLSATGTGVAGAGTTSLVISGSLTQVQSDLATLTDTDASATADSIKVTASDSFGNTAGPAAIAVTVTPQLVLAPGSDTGGPAGQGGALLPAGYLSTSGNQIVDAAGNPVRIASIGWDGTDGLTNAPYGLWQSSLQQNINAIKADGFNTIRIPWTDVLLTASPEETAGYYAINPALNPQLVGLTSLQLLNVLVADAGAAGLKVIFDHADNNGGPGGWGGQQANGLWFDSGPGSNGTDGSGTTGTITAAQFQADSVALAKNFAGNSTVIGFDLDNEPTSAGNINWGKGGPTDIQAMYTQVGDAIQAVDPGALIIAEGPEEWSGPAPGMPAGFAEGDLSGVATDPVTLTIPDKVVYSVHEYPPDLSGNGSYNVSQQIAAMNAGWGYLETNNIAPVWIGEMGSNMTSAADQAWIQTLLDYMNGKDGAVGGPTFTGNQQPISGSWWQWGSAPGQTLQGVETAWGSGQYWPAQQVATNQLLYTPISTAVLACFAQGTRILTPHGEVAVETLSPGDLVTTSSGAAHRLIWVGHRQISRAGHPDPDDMMPIRISAGAFAPSAPARDLFLSPDHAVFANGVLIPIRHLVNGTTIAREPRDEVTYWHLELARHDILLAEGLPAESYLDTGNRHAFDANEQELRLLTAS